MRGCVHQPAALDGQNEYAAAGSGDDAGAVRRNVRGGGVIEGVLIQCSRKPIEIGSAARWDGLVGAGSDVVEVQIGAHLVDDAALRKATVALDVPTLMVRVLFEVLSVRIHRPEVHAAIAIGEEIDAAVPPHGVLAGAREVAGERHGFLARGVLPNLLRGSALVALGLAALKWQAREEEGVAAGSQTPCAAWLRGTSSMRFSRVDGGELSVGQRRVAAGGVEDFAARSPADDLASPSKVRRVGSPPAAGIV